jgi:hypothetical protein
MGDLWDDDGFGGGGAAAPELNGDDAWDEGEESLTTSLEDGFDDAARSPEDDSWDDDDTAD